MSNGCPKLLVCKVPTRRSWVKVTWYWLRCKNMIIIIFIYWDKEISYKTKTKEILYLKTLISCVKGMNLMS